MRGHLALNLAMLAVVVALAWLALSPQEPPPEPTLPIVSIAQEAVHAIRIEVPDRSAVELVREGDRWLLHAPLSAPADGFRVAALLGLTQARSAEGFRAAGNDLAQYGLDPPHAVVRFDQQALRIGGTDPVAHKRYVLVADQVHLLEDRWFSQIFGEPAAWVDPRPLMGAQRLAALHLPTADWRLVDGRWQRSPPDPDLSADAGTVLADGWRQARALAVSGYDETIPWGDSITIDLANQPEAYRFRLARDNDILLLARPQLGVQYRFLVRQGEVLLGKVPE